MKNQGIADRRRSAAFVTAAYCLLGMYVEGDMASTALNVIHSLRSYCSGTDPSGDQERKSINARFGNKNNLYCAYPAAGPSWTGCRFFLLFLGIDMIK